MAQATDDFDFGAYRERLAAAGVEATRDFVDSGHYDAHDALSEAAFEIADEEVAYNSVNHALAILESSPNEPEEWQPFAEGKTAWREVIRAMAFTVVRQDFYDALEVEGYLDDRWNPTDKLEDAVGVEA